MNQNDEDRKEEVKVFHQENELPSLLKQIVQEIREDADKGLYNDWNVSYKDLKFCNLKCFFDNEVQLEVFELYGGFRLGEEDPRELAKRSKDTKRLMDKFVKELKKRFKDRAGKNLTFKNIAERVNFELIAPSGLYRFYCIKRVKVSTQLPGQEWSKED